jgi:hypothetical protein
MPSAPGAARQRLQVGEELAFACGTEALRRRRGSWRRRTRRALRRRLRRHPGRCRGPARRARRAGAPTCGHRRPERFEHAVPLRPRARASRMRRADHRGPARSASSTGRQSATIIVQAMPRSVVQQASASCRRRVARSAHHAACHAPAAGTPAAPAAARRSGAVLGHGARVVADVVAQVQRWRTGRRTRRPRARRCRPRARRPGTGQSGTASMPLRLVVRAVGGLRLLEGRMPHAGLERRHGARQPAEVDVEALAVEDLRHQAAVGQRRRVAVAVASPAGRRCQLALVRSRPSRTQCRYQVFLASSSTFSRAPGTSARAGCSADGSRRRSAAPARARLGGSPVEVFDDGHRRAGSSGGCGCVSSRYSMMAIDCAEEARRRRRSSSVGTRPEGDTARTASCLCSPLTRCTGR